MSKFLTVKCMNPRFSEAAAVHKDYIHRPQSPTRRPHTHSSNFDTRERYAESKAFTTSATIPATEVEQAVNVEATSASRTFVKNLIREVLDEMGINSFIETQEARHLETQRQLRQLTQTLVKVRDVLEANSDDILNLQGQIDDTQHALEAFKDETKGTLESLASDSNDRKAGSDVPCLLSIQKELADIRFELSTIKTVSKFF
ncbi:Hypothetical protein GLP15_4941 [Giardia lamblia P15]|uniref:Uncharacterized protein n=1 Tax=Giardia intestinalis (strain P15) TaxID=658858 RepID=E1F0V4_GIAIA|nr:Hypothetical protein GLP15_4941 [Giardia lamblia P15]